MTGVMLALLTSLDVFIYKIILSKFVGIHSLRFKVRVAGYFGGGGRRCLYFCIK